MADCAAAGVPLSSPAPLAHRCAAAGLDSGTPAELLASMPFDGAVDRANLFRPRIPIEMAGSRKTSKSPIYAKPPSKGELMRISASSTRRVCFRARTWLDQDQLF